MTGSGAQTFGPRKTRVRRIASIVLLARHGSSGVSAAHYAVARRDGLGVVGTNALSNHTCRHKSGYEEMVSSQASDHDPQVARFLLPPSRAAVTDA